MCWAVELFFWLFGAHYVSFAALAGCMNALMAACVPAEMKCLDRWLREKFRLERRIGEFIIYTWNPA
ncbi:MAG: hypothetical protein ABIJ96_02215 [Elusimicrobiota bacterium]